ncbi:SagB/ThcOx family dehydrogenase [Methylomicrobium lacus]|uniref:SagB/ThcOx family dehydrogenase n=1 Tax=Methylomicrobium lacus TaxID=136992 RepID=UPI0035A97BFB
MNVTAMIPMVLVSQAMHVGEIIHLPPAKVKGEMSLEESIAKRRSIREFAAKPLSIEQIGQLLWAAQGITEKDKGLRAAPSAGALYPLETYVVLPEGVYHYNPQRHELKRVLAGDRRLELQKAARDQEAIGSAPAVLVFTGVYERTAAKYGDRASRYVSIEAGHACQNVLLQATAQNLASVPVGPFEDTQVAKIINLAKNENPLYLMPVGYPME